MSFPNIPDIEPYINITQDDAVNLLLASIACEEMSLAKLIDAETSKVLFVLHESRHKESALQDAVEINKSVDDTIINIIKLQMLLQFKLEKVKELVPVTTSSTTTTTTSSTTTTTTTKSTTSTTTTKTTTSTTSTCSTTTKKECSCCVAGKGKGCVTNCSDEFYGFLAALNVFLPSYDRKNRSLCYKVRDNTESLQLFASDYEINIQCCSHDPNSLVAFGKAGLDSECRPGKLRPVKFNLLVMHKNSDNFEIRMEITTDDLKPIHDSGIMHMRISL